jgi:hypothetical protein
MSRRIKIVILSAVAIGLLLLVPRLFVDQKFPETSSELEREIRIGLPIGSPLSTVEAYLKRRNVEFHVNGQTVNALARGLKGSTMVTRRDLLLQFHFDDSSTLKSIDAKPGTTSP